MITSNDQPILDLYADVRATPVPVLAVVQGEARGFGCALVGQCDLAIAVESARFSLPELETNLPPTLAISIAPSGTRGVVNAVSYRDSVRTFAHLRNSEDLGAVRYDAPMHTPC